MRDDIYEKLSEIKIENFILSLFIAAAIIDILANEDIKKSYVRGDGKEDARKKFILASLLVLIGFSYFVYHNYKKLKQLNPNSQEYHYAYIRFIGSVFAVIGELLILYYFLNTSQLKNRV